MRRRTKWLLGGLGGALLAVGTGFQLMRLGYEEPAYEVVAEHGPLEVRRYAPRVVAQTVVSGAEGDVTGEGFRRRGWPALQLGARRLLGRRLRSRATEGLPRGRSSPPRCSAFAPSSRATRRCGPFRSLWWA